jgi:multiple sugar transport system permease protein
LLTVRQRVLLALPFILIVVPFMILPAIFGLVASFTDFAPYQKAAVHFVGFSNYLRLVADRDFQAAVRNVAIFTVVTVACELMLGVAVAYALRRPFRGRGIVRFILLIPWLVSPVANGVMWHYLFNVDFGLINFIPALFGLARPPSALSSGLALPAAMTVDIWRKAPLVAFLVVPGILAIPAVQWDLADLEGASTLTRLRHIVLPRLRILLLTIALLLVGDALGTSESMLILTGGGPGSETTTPGLYSYWQAIKIFDWTSGSTSAWLIAAAVGLVGVVYVILTRSETSQ